MGPPPISVDQFSLLVGLLYDASLAPQQWQRALLRMRELFAANYVTLILRPPGAEDLGLMVVASETAIEYYSSEYLTSPFTGLPPDRAPSFVACSRPPARAKTPSILRQIGYSRLSGEIISLMFNSRTTSGSAANQRASTARPQFVRRRFGETAIAKHAPPPSETRTRARTCFWGAS